MECAIPKLSDENLFKMATKDFSILIENMNPDESLKFWRACQAYANQYPYVEFWCVVMNVIAKPKQLWGL